jgi:dienelactone hydrolase
VNSFWTRLARKLAERGLAVLRIDYSREGETLPIGEGGAGQIWKHDLDMRLVRQALAWFRERLGEKDFFLLGACSGGRAAIELAGGQPGTAAGVFLLVPYLRPLAQPGKDQVSAKGDESVDPQIVDWLRGLHGGPPTWILVGEEDWTDVSRVERLLCSAGDGVELEVVSGAALHLLDQPEIQDETERRLLARLRQVLDAH